MLRRRMDVRKLCGSSKIEKLNAFCVESVESGGEAGLKRRCVVRVSKGVINPSK